MLFDDRATAQFHGPCLPVAHSEHQVRHPCLFPYLAPAGIDRPESSGLPVFVKRWHDDQVVLRLIDVVAPFQEIRPCAPWIRSDLHRVVHALLCAAPLFKAQLHDVPRLCVDDKEIRNRSCIRIVSRLIHY